MVNSDARILVVTDVGSDADLLRLMLRKDYLQVEVSTTPERFVADFKQHRPQVLVLALKTLEQAERWYLGLPGHGSLIGDVPHRTVLLCAKDELRAAFDLCRNDYFDDYVLFWPLAQDASRLSMSVHLALRSLEREQAAAPHAQLATQTQRIADLEAQLAGQLALGRDHAEQVRKSADQAQAEVGQALDAFSRHLIESGLDEAVEVRDPARVQQAVSRLNDEAVQPLLRKIARVVTPMQEWIDSLTTTLAEPLQAAREIGEHARQMRPLLLVVDDDEFLRKLLGRVLGTAHYDLEMAASGAEALALLRRRRPDLILMDVCLPDINGIEMTRRLKASEAYAGIPVIMLTGQSEKLVLNQSLAAGAADFIIKPFDREIVLKKVARHLHDAGQKPYIAPPPQTHTRTS